MIFVNINIAYLFSSSLQPKFYNSLKSKDENLRKLKFTIKFYIILNTYLHNFISIQINLQKSIQLLKRLQSFIKYYYLMI